MDRLMLFAIADYKLTDLLGSASATIGVIIGGTIFRQFLSGKYLELLSRYRSLTGEYRGSDAKGSRHGLLQAQIRTYRLRLWLISRASWLSGAALLCLLISVLAGGLSMLWPEDPASKVVGTIGIFLGLVLIGLGVVIDLIEGFVGRDEIGQEVGDLDDRAKTTD